MDIEVTTVTLAELDDANVRSDLREFARSWWIFLVGERARIPVPADQSSPTLQAVRERVARGTYGHRTKICTT